MKDFRGIDICVGNTIACVYYHSGQNYLEEYVVVRDLGDAIVVVQPEDVQEFAKDTAQKYLRTRKLSKSDRITIISELTKN